MGSRRVGRVMVCQAPGLIDSVNHEELAAITATLVPDNTGHEESMTARLRVVSICSSITREAKQGTGMLSDFDGVVGKGSWFHETDFFL